MIAPEIGINLRITKFFIDFENNDIPKGVIEILSHSIFD